MGLRHLCSPPCWRPPAAAHPPHTHPHPPPTPLSLAEGSGYEREQLSSEVSQRYAAAAKALHGSESMEGVAGARSRPVTGARSALLGGGASGVRWPQHGWQQGLWGCCIPPPIHPSTKQHPTTTRCQASPSLSSQHTPHLPLTPLSSHRGARLPPAVQRQGRARVPGGIRASHLRGRGLGALPRRGLLLHTGALLGAQCTAERHRLTPCMHPPPLLLARRWRCLPTPRWWCAASRAECSTSFSRPSLRTPPQPGAPLQLHPSPLQRMPMLQLGAPAGCGTRSCDPTSPATCRPQRAQCRQEEVARCLEAVNHGAADGPLGARHLGHSRSLPNLADSHGGIDDRPMATPADSMDSGAGALAASPSMLHGGTPRHGRLGVGNTGGAVVSTGEDDRLSGHPDHSVLCLAAANGLLFSGGTDGTIKVGAGHGVMPAPACNCRVCSCWQQQHHHLTAPHPAPSCLHPRCGR